VRYRAVFFDAGGTLVDPHPTFTELLSSTLRAEGYDVSPEQIVERLPKFVEHFARAARERELWSTTPERSRRFWGAMYRELMEDLGFPFPDELGERLYAVFTDPSNYQLFPDVLPILDKLQQGGLVLGLISNFEEWLERLLEFLEVTGYFDVRVISGVEGVEKPDPAIFELALRRAGVGAEESVYVGDNVTFDVEPAGAVGMTAILIDRRDRNPDHEGLRITSMDELPAVIGL
jgi:putative hydrolase of the HAD superfamily